MIEELTTNDQKMREDLFRELNAPPFQDTLHQRWVMLKILWHYQISNYIKTGVRMFTPIGQDDNPQDEPTHTYDDSDKGDWSPPPPVIVEDCS